MPHIEYYTRNSNLCIKYAGTSESDLLPGSNKHSYTSVNNLLCWLEQKIGWRTDTCTYCIVNAFPLQLYLVCIPMQSILDILLQAYNYQFYIYCQEDNVIH